MKRRCCRVLELSLKVNEMVDEVLPVIHSEGWIYLGV